MPVPYYEKTCWLPDLVPHSSQSLSHLAHIDGARTRIVAPFDRLNLSAQTAIRRYIMPQPRVHSTLQKLYEAAGEHGATVALEGYVGPAPSGKVRLYGSMRLGSCVELPEDAIVHFEEDEASGRTTIYVHTEAPLTVMTVATISAAQLRDLSISGGTPASSSVAALTALLRRPRDGMPGGGTTSDCVDEKRQKCIDDRIISGTPPDRAERVCDSLAWLFEILCDVGPLGTPGGGGIIIA